jgi:exonuclease SbcD
VSLKLLHFGDLHLDGAFERLSPEKAAARRKATRALLDQIAALAREEKVDLVFCAGDLFDGPTPYYDTIEAAASAFASLAIPVFIAPGNHDWFDDHSPYAAIAWSDNVHIFQGLTPTPVELPHLNCRVYGVGYTERRPPITRMLTDFQAPEDGIINLFLAHGEVGNTGEYLVFGQEEIEKANLAYLALGHIHRHCQTQVGQTLVVQSGSVEGHGFDEPGEKGVVIAEISKEGATATLVPLPGSRCVPVSLDVTPFMEMPDPEKAIAEEAAKIAEKVCPAERAFLRLDLLGTGEINENKIKENLRQFLALRLTSDVRPPVSPFDKAGDDSLTGLFVRTMKEKYDAASEEEKEKILLALSFGLAAIENREDIISFRGYQPEGKPI